MAKAAKKKPSTASEKSPKEASNLFHNIMKASVSKPVKKAEKPKAVKKKK